jgi:ABC-type uncharacterized transport system permease subunit
MRSSPRLLPLPATRLLLAVAATLAVVAGRALTRANRGPLPARRTGRSLAALHWLLGVVSYGLFAVAVLHAWLLDGARAPLAHRRRGPLRSRPAACRCCSWSD